MQACNHIGMDIETLIRRLGHDAEAARRLGVNRSTISRLRRGLTRPSWGTVEKLLRAQARELKRVVRR